MGVFGVPTDDQLSQINKLAKRKLAKEEVFVFPSKLAGDMIIPGRNVQLTKSLLDVFASDAIKGVSLLLDHSWSADGFFGLGGRPKAAIPYGRTFSSRFEASSEEGETISLVSDTYMVKGVEIDGIKTNDLAASIEGGTLFDTSIGFSYSKATCSVCGEDYYSCEHMPGRTYEIEDADGITRNKLCYIKAEAPGYLMENSLVFDGAYPNAGVLSRAGEIVENNNGTFEVVNDFKGMDTTKPLLGIYSNRAGLVTMVKKSEPKNIHSLGGIGKSISDSGHIIGDSLNQILKGVESSMNEKVLKMLETFGIAYKEGETKLDEILSQVVTKWESSLQSMQDSAEPLIIPEAFMTKEKATESLGSELSSDEVLKLAKEGQSYHEELSKDAIAMGVRAQGNDFPAETWKSTFATMGTKQIKDIMSTFEKQASSSIPIGRSTSPSAGPTQAMAQAPDDAFKVKK